VIHSGVEATGPSGLVLVTHYEIGDKSTNVLSLPRLNALDVVEITELEPRVQVTVREHDVMPVLNMVQWYLKDMALGVHGSADDWVPHWYRGQQCALAIKAVAAHLSQIPQETAQAIADRGLAWQLVSAAQDAQLVEQCNIEDSIQVLEFLTHQVLLPIVTGHDRRQQLPMDVLEQLNAISFNFGCPLSIVIEIFTDCGGLETCDYNATTTAVASRNDFAVAKPPVEPHDFLSENSVPEPSLEMGADPLPQLDSIPVRHETLDELGMQTVSTGLGKLGLKKKHLLIQELLRNEEVWRTNAPLFLARAYERLAKLNALLAASRLLQHWPCSIPIAVDSVSSMLMLIYRCVACGMERKELMGCVSSIVAREDCGATTVRLVQAACIIARQFVQDHNAGQSPEHAALDVALAILSAAIQQTKNPCVAQELLQVSTIKHLLAVAHLAVGVQRRTLLRLLAEVVAEVTNVLEAVGSVEEWNRLWVGLQEGFWAAFQQTVGSQDGGIFGSLSLQSYTECFLSVRQALQRADQLQQTHTQIVQLYPDPPAMELSEAPRALARFMAVADGATTFLNGRTEPPALRIGINNNEMPLDEWMSLVECIHATDANTEFKHPSLELAPVQWQFAQYQQLASCLDLISSSLENLPDWSSGEIDLVPFSSLQGIPAEVLAQKSLLLLRFSALMMSVLPLLDLFSKDEAAAEMGAIRKMRGLILGKHKSEVISKVKAMCRVVSSQPRGSRGSWCNIEIDRIDARPGNSIFRQIFNKLRLHNMLSHNDLYRGATQQMWYIDFVGENSMDWSGAFRESFCQLGMDLCSDNNDLLIRVPNHDDNDGFHQDCWIPNPDCQAMEQLEFMGRLMAAAILSDEYLLLQLPPMVWKQIAGIQIVESDLREIALLWCRSMDSVRSCEYISPDSNEVFTIDENDFEATFPLKWSAKLSSGTVVELNSGGISEDSPNVLYCNRELYVNMAYKKRIEESSVQVDAIRRGLTAIIPIQVLKLWTFREFELAVCGEPHIPLEGMMANVVWDLDRNAPEVEHLWSAVKRFSNEERSLLLRFATGRSRLPVKLKLSAMGGGPSALPTSHTCFFQLCLPPYRDEEVAYQKIRYAIHNCMEMDGD